MTTKIKTFTSHSEDSFNPYSVNSGTSLAIKCNNHIIVASDMRNTSDYNIHNRSTSKIFQINDFFIATTGFYADSYEISVKLNYNSKIYEMQCNKQINIKELVHLNFNTLYNKRFFPHYTYCIISGYDKETHEPLIYSYDPVGNYGSVNVQCNGTGTSMIQPLLDQSTDLCGMNEDESVKLVRMLFEAASERDIRTGDLLEVVVIRKDSYEKKYFELRKD